MNEQVLVKSKQITDDLRNHILNYLKSEGAGGKKIVAAFMSEFENLAYRSPPDDPTNIINHMDFLENHIKNTLDSSIHIDENGNINLGICTDTLLGFKEDKSSLKHHPQPLKWVVYLIRGIAGEYAFVNNNTYFLKYSKPMPAQYNGGFLVGKWLWDREGWNIVGDFARFRHPASKASPIPFFKNVLEKINLHSLMDEAKGSFRTDGTN